MLASRHYGTLPLRIEKIAEPALRPGSAIVRVLAAMMPPSVAEVLSGQYSNPEQAPQNPLYLPPMPHTPGYDCVGAVEAVADDVAGLEVGQKVYCDGFYASNNVNAPWDGCYIGYMGFTPASAKLMERWPDGPYAEKVIYPAECLTPLEEAGDQDLARVARLGYIGTAYGAYLRGGLRAGQTLIVSGATGIVGVSAVVLALSLGVARVVATGRKQHVLDELQRLDPRRVIPIRLEGTANDAVRIAQAAKGADMVVDSLVGLAKDVGPTLAAIGALRRPGGVAIMVGGVMADLPISYTDLAWKGISLGVGPPGIGGSLSDLTGALWFPRSAARDLVRMIGSGVLNLSPLRPHVYPLDKINDALAASNSRPGGFDHVVIKPAQD
jgi:alcohol dehydrogenase